jgi:arylformamidase
MKLLIAVLLGVAWTGDVFAQAVARNVAYASTHERQVLDVYAPTGAKHQPVVFWIHGGGWQAGDKGEVTLKPASFNNAGFLFVSTNYRLLPNVEMGDIVRDVAAAIGWVHRNIARHGGDPNRLLVMGHSAGGQLAALLCTDDRYLKAEGVPLSVVKGCVPVDADTFDIPAIIDVAETRWRVHGLPKAPFGHREKFGNDPARHRHFSAVTHVEKGKNAPPFLLLHVAEHPDTTAQARRFAAVLQAAGIPVTVFGARETTHTQLNDNLGQPEDPATAALWTFVRGVVK